MFHSAALKLTVWYLAIVMAISFVFSMSLYHVSSTDLERNVNRQVGYFNNILGPDDAQNYRLIRDRQLDEDLNHLKANLLLFNLLVLVSGGLASYMLARRTLQPLEAALESQSRFASDASHELRTPLTVIQTENEVALRNKNLTKQEALSLLKSNLEEVGKLKTLSEGLLSLAQANGKISDPQPVPLKPLAGLAIERHSAEAAAKRIKVANKVGRQLALGDRQSLLELISLFLDNAIKYNPSKTAVNISSKTAKDYVELSIEDNGAGIEAKDLPRIFERFYRPDNSRARHGPGGYGLGLAIAKKIAEAHGGYIEVKSTVGKGTTFRIFLPGHSNI